MIIGLTGTTASGKGFIADLLIDRGFKYSSTSDRIREEAENRGLKNYKLKKYITMALVLLKVKEYINILKREDYILLW